MGEGIMRIGYVVIGIRDLRARCIRTTFDPAGSLPGAAACYAPWVKARQQRLEGNVSEAWDLELASGTLEVQRPN